MVFSSQRGNESRGLAEEPASNEDSRPSEEHFEVTILLVEDDSVYVEYVGRMLCSPRSAHAGDARFEVVRVETLSEALQELSAGRVFDLILLDLGLPDSQGLYSLVRIREATPEIPVVVVSVCEDDALAMDAVRYGAQDYLVKSVVHASMLVRVIRYTIERRRAQEELLL